jgi:hypothetical protein
LHENRFEYFFLKLKKNNLQGASEQRERETWAVVILQFPIIARTIEAAAMEFSLINFFFRYRIILCRLQKEINVHYFVKVKFPTRKKGFEIFSSIFCKRRRRCSYMHNNLLAFGCKFCQAIGLDSYVLISTILFMN